MSWFLALWISDVARTVLQRPENARIREERNHDNELSLLFAYLYLLHSIAQLLTQVVNKSGCKKIAHEQFQGCSRKPDHKARTSNRW